MSIITKPLTAMTLVAAAFGFSAAAQAQYVGPSSIPVLTAQALVQDGRDDQHAVLRGRLVSHDGGEHYTFEDESGRIAVEIDAKRMPLGRPFDATQRLELTGKLDRDFRKVEFDVKQVRFLD